MPRKNKTRSSKKSARFLHPASLDKDTLQQLYANMLRCRMFAEKLQQLDTQSISGPALMEPGHEAITTGMLAGRRPDDRIASGSQSLATRLICGEPVKSIVGELMGSQRVRPSKRTEQALRGLVPASLTPAAQINLALGAAWAFRTHGDQQVAINFWSEEMAASDEFRDAVNFSVQHKLSVIHVVEISTESHVSHTYSQLPEFAIDGYDAIAVYRVGQEAVRRARQGRGPALIECLVNRRPRAVIPSPSTDRVPSETDPVLRMEDYLRRKGFWSDRWKRSLVASFARELTRAMDTAERSRLRVVSSEAETSALAITG
jgi:TPP-dependent pyruvate/acetoin dehydrogenase alpha subunit